MKSWKLEGENEVTKNNLLFFAVVLIYVVLNNILLIKDYYWMLIIPVVAVLAWYMFFRPSAVILLMAMLTPLSVKIDFETSGLSLNLPNEPMIAGLMVLFFLNLFLTGNYDKRITRHPITIAIILNLSWIFITCFSSSLPLVSFKFFISRLWFIVVFYIMTVELFRNIDYVKNFIWLFAITLVIVVFYTLFIHSQSFFTQESADRASFPFMKGHTIYACILALILPFTAGFTIMSKKIGLLPWQKYAALAISVVLAVGIVFSYTRAAWISLLAAACFLFLLLLKVRFRFLLFLLAAGIFIILTNLTRIYTSLTSREQKISSTNFDEHIKSISNITTDLSNTERLNRWSCAVRMFRERPVFGWGPGTYMFQYAPFQLAQERTYISTDFGDLGNAHSEFLGPLAESGFPGLITVLVLIIVVIYKGMQLYYKLEDPAAKYISLFILLSFVTYFTHGVLNNYLDTDKASVPFWAMLAMLTSFDLFYKKKDSVSEKEN